MRTAAVALALLSIAASPADQTAAGFTNGVGALTLRGGSTRITRLMYYHAGDTHRTSFTAMTSVGSTAFSGGRSIQPGPEHYTLLLDSIIEMTGLSPDTVRDAAVGACDVVADPVRPILRQLNCTAKTDFGTLRLTFKGDGQARQRPVARE